MKTINCPICEEYFDPRVLQCPVCKYDLFDSIPERFKNFGKIQVIYFKKDCIIYSLGREYVLKFLYGEKTEAGAREAAVLTQLRGTPKIIRLEDCELDGDYVYLLERRYSTLSEYIRSRPIHLEDIWRIAYDICEALIFCEKNGFYHLDVHPKNIYIDSNGHALLGDFGNAQRIADANPKHLREITPRYVHPIYHLAENYTISDQWDLFGLCMVLYGLLNEGKLPYMELSPKEAAANIYLEGAVPLLGQDELSSIVIQGLKGKFHTEEFFNALKNICLYPKSMSSVPKSAPTSAKNYSKGISFKGMEAHRYDYSELLVKCESPRKENKLFKLGRDIFFKWISAKISDASPSHKKSSDKKVYTYPNNIQKREFDADNYAKIEVITYSKDEKTETSTLNRVFDSENFATSLPLSSDYLRDEGEYISVSGTIFDADDVAQSMASGEIFDADPIAMTVVSFANESCVNKKNIDDHEKFSKDATQSIDTIKFSAVTEKKLVVGQANLIEVVMYTDQFNAILEEAKKEVGEEVKTTNTGEVEVYSKSKVKIKLTSCDIPIEEDTDEFIWNGKYQKSFFIIEIPNGYAKKKVSFKAYISINNLPAVRLFFIAGIDEEQRNIDIDRYNIHSAFMSYASDDRDIVTAFKQGIKKGRPDMDIFMDIENLRSGSDWEQKLYEAIDRRDILFLCWSNNAKQSKWVDREWRYALDKKGLDFIEPLPIDKCTPPTELSSKHFNDMEVLIRAAFK